MEHFEVKNPRDCSKEAIFLNLVNNRCQYVQNNCLSEWRYVNFYKLHFCYLDENYLVTFFCGVFLMFKQTLLLFLQVHILDFVSDKYISAAVSRFAHYLKFSESLAGATLLAFSNGVPDLFTAILASENTETDELAIGSLFGASSFALTIILAISILSSKERSISGFSTPNFNTHLLFFIIGILLFILLGFLNLSYLICGCLLFGIYIVYVIKLVSKEHEEKPLIRKNKTKGLGIREVSDYSLKNEPDNNFKLNGGMSNGLSSNHENLTVNNFKLVIE